MERSVYQRLARWMLEDSDLKSDPAAARGHFPSPSILHFFRLTSFTLWSSFIAKCSFPQHVLLAPFPLSTVPLFSVHLSPSHSAFPLKTKKTKDQGIAQTAAETPAVTACNKPLLSIPLRTLSHFPISPHSLRDTLYWFPTATSVKPINISGWGMKSIDNTPPRVAGIFFFSHQKKKKIQSTGLLSKSQ